MRLLNSLALLQLDYTAVDLHCKVTVSPTTFFFMHMRSTTDCTSELQAANMTVRSVFLLHNPTASSNIN